jgi:hypothetical protein
VGQALSPANLNFTQLVFISFGGPQPHGRGPEKALPNRDRKGVGAFFVPPMGMSTVEPVVSPADTEHTPIPPVNPVIE